MARYRIYGSLAENYATSYKGTYECKDFSTAYKLARCFAETEYFIESLKNDSFLTYRDIQKLHPNYTQRQLLSCYFWRVEEKIQYYALEEEV
jgi:hypothetical protein